MQLNEADQALDILTAAVLILRTAMPDRRFLASMSAALCGLDRDQKKHDSTRKSK
jgi:hypothetical protein